MIEVALVETVVSFAEVFTVVEILGLNSVTTIEEPTENISEIIVKTIYHFFLGCLLINIKINKTIVKIVETYQTGLKNASTDGLIKNGISIKIKNIKIHIRATIEKGLFV
jgi:hypothetical protein